LSLKINNQNDKNFHKIAICTPPKTGTTSWQALMIAVQRNVTLNTLINEKRQWEENVYGKLKRLKYEIIKAARKDMLVERGEGLDF